MSSKTDKFSRRDFLKTAGAVGIGSMLFPIGSLTNAQESSNPNETPIKGVPTRPFGKTGVDVSILSLGGAFHYSNLLLMKQALNMGIQRQDMVVDRARPVLENTLKNFQRIARKFF